MTTMPMQHPCHQWNRRIRFANDESMLDDLLIPASPAYLERHSFSSSSSSSSSSGGGGGGGGNDSSGFYGSSAGGEASSHKSNNRHHINSESLYMLLRFWEELRHFSGTSATDSAAMAAVSQAELQFERTFEDDPPTRIVYNNNNAADALLLSSSMT
jgi:hypothetical protein